jgi:beta-lactamase class A
MGVNTEQVDHLLGRVGGQAGAAAQVLAPDGVTVLAEYHSREAEVFPIASSFKLFVLHALFEDVAAGRRSLDTEIATTRAITSLGDRKPQRSSLRRLAQMMIYHSGNTASDALFKLVGLDAPQRLIARLGLERTRVVLPTREYYVIIAGLDPEFPPDDLPAAAARFAALAPAAQAACIGRVAARAAEMRPRDLERATEPFYGYERYSRPEAYAILEGVDNASTPRAMLRLMRFLHAGGGLPPALAEEMRHILARGDGARDAGAFHGQAVAWGGKGGNDISQSSMNGYAVAADGRTLVYSLLAARLHDEYRAADRLTHALRALWEALMGPGGPT